MPGPGPSAMPRMGGGFNPGMGGGFDEHMQENAMQSAAGQKQLAQQAADPQTAAAAAQRQNPLQQPAAPREIGSLADELIKRPMKDIAAGLLSIFSVNNILGIDPVTDSPEKQAKKKQIHQRWNALNQEQQQIAQQKYQENLQRKQREEEEKQMRKQQEEQERANSIQMPSSPKKGAQGPAGGSAKQKATNQLNTSRKQLSNPQSAN